MAGIHWGFGSELAPLALTFQHWPGVSLYTSTCVLAQTCVFGKQSLGPLCCDPRKLTEQVLHLQGRSFSLSYGSNLPSSLTTVLSRA